MNRGAIMRAAVGLVLSATLAAPAEAAPPEFSASSASSRSTSAKNAADGRTSTAWTAAHKGAWSWTGRLRTKQRLAQIRILTTGASQPVKVTLSRSGRTFTTAAKITLRPDRWSNVTVDGKEATMIRVTSTSSRRRGRLTEVQVKASDHKQPEPPDNTPDDTRENTQNDTSADDRQRRSDPGPGDQPPKKSAVRNPTGPAPAPTPSSGQFAGVVRNPVDPAQLKGMPFGARSHWLQPWRAYMDTVPASRLRDAIGINFNPMPSEAQPVARLVAASGFRRARMEIAWGELSYNNPATFRDVTPLRTKLRALRDHGLRPLILLNSDSGRPAPAKDETLNVTALALPGARQVQLDAASAAKVIPGKTGLNGVYPAEYLITSISGTTATLSKPLPVWVPPSTYPAMTFRYQPFSPLRNNDGTANPAGEATMQGWLDYVDTVTEFVRGELGSSQFDVEISNEANLNAQFYDINEYHEPDLFTSRTDDQVIADRTAAWIKDPAQGLSGVRVTNGFASQRPWDSGATSSSSIDALSKHYYPRNLRFPTNALAGNEPRDALGQTSGTRIGGGWQDTFAPTYDSFFPEYSLTGIGTETITRDLAPWTESWRDLSGRTSPHGRTVASPGGGVPEIWMTEIGLEAAYALQTLGQQMTVADVERMRAKSALRTLTSYVNKGVTQVDLFSAGTAEWTLIGYDFWNALSSNPVVYPGDAAGGPTMLGVRRLADTLAAKNITEPRTLTLASIGDYEGRSQFVGAGTPAHPTLYDRDVLAFLPFQASDHRFVVPVYVMTRNMAKIQQPNLPGTDPARYDLPAARYQLTVGGTDAQTARVTAVDPLTGAAVPVDVVRRTAEGWLVVELPVTDSPRLLIIDDTTAG